VAWVLALSRDDPTVTVRLAEDPSLATASCHFTGLSPIHWAVKHNNRNLLHSLLTDYSVSPDSVCRAGYTPLHLAAIYGRREIYNDLLEKYRANSTVKDFSGQVASVHLELGHSGFGANCRGINRIWQDLALDIQSYQAECFEQQRNPRHVRRNNANKEHFDGRKKRHSLGF